MLARLGGFIPEYFIRNVRQIIKPKEFIAYPADMNFFNWYYVKSPHRVVTTLSVVVKKKKEGEADDRTLTAHRLTLPVETLGNTETPVKKAIVYLTGNCFYVAESMPKREPLLRMLQEEAKKAGANVQFAFFCQDYRGRGFNQETPEENFHRYTVEQDAKDQATLIRKLVEEEGYLPENIFLLSYSMGSAVALWALYLLVKEQGIHYADIKNYSDRGYGNLFDFPLVSWFVADQAEAHERLHQIGMMPDIFLPDLAQQLPETLATNTVNEEMMVMNVGLTEGLKAEEMPGRVWVLDTSHPERINPHLTEHADIRLKNLPEVTSPYFMLAMMLETPIQLSFPVEPPKEDSGQCISGYALKKEAMLPSLDYIALPPFPKGKEKEAGSSSLSVAINTVADFVSRLHRYCVERGEEARESGLGAVHNRAWLSSTGMTGWSAKQQMEMAVTIMGHLIRAEGPDIAALTTLQDQNGPHQSGRLYFIFADVMKFVTEYKQLRYFNQWVATMQERRENRHKKAAESTISLDDIFITDPDIACHWEPLGAPLSTLDKEEQWELIYSPPALRRS